VGPVHSLIESVCTNIDLSLNRSESLTLKVQNSTVQRARAHTHTLQSLSRLETQLEITVRQLIIRLIQGKYLASGA